MQKLAGTWFDSKFEIKRALRFLFLFFFLGGFCFSLGLAFLYYLLLYMCTYGV